MKRGQVAARLCLSRVLLLASLALCADAGFNQMARTPPLGWRSWNQHGCNISQPDIEAAMRGLTDTSRPVWNRSVPTSLLDLGFSNAGLDDCYQQLLTPACTYPGSGVDARRAARAAACTDPNTSFPIDYDGKQCQGLAGPLPGVSTPDACARACCADATCEVWQFCTAGHCGGSAAPPNSCYTGAINACAPSAGWVSRGVASPPHHFHDANGRPVVNASRFPDMLAMTNLAHSLGLTAGWYGNNCFCRENSCGEDCVRGDVDALVDFGYDAVKYDGCGPENNMTLWAQLFAGTSKGDGMVLENCNNDNALIPRAGDDLTRVPFHFYRTSTDIRPTYGSVVYSWQSMLRLSSGSGPSCWAYPDMLEVGVTTQILTAQKVPREPRAHLGETVIVPPGTAAYAALEAAAPLPPVLTVAESRAHFSMWSIASAPLTLSLDFRDAATVDAVWDIIANPEALGVNQAWAGHRGGLLREGAPTVTLPHCTWIWAGDINCTVPVEQQFWKPLPGGSAAVLVANHGGAALSTSINISAVPGLACAPGPCSVRDVNSHVTIGPFTGYVPVVDLPPHDVAFAVLFTPTP